MKEKLASLTVLARPVLQLNENGDGKQERIQRALDARGFSQREKHYQVERLARRGSPLVQNASGHAPGRTRRSLRNDAPAGRGRLSQRDKRYHARRKVSEASFRFP